MEKILNELKEQTKELRFLRKLMEEVYLSKDEHTQEQKDKKQKVQNSLNLLKDQIIQAPALQGNAEARTMITEIFKMM